MSSCTWTEESRMLLPLSRREMLHRVGTGMGVLGLGALLADEASAANPLAPKGSHFRPRAKRVIHLFMNGGPSQVDTFDPKPSLVKYSGQQPPSGIKRTERKTGGLMPSPFKFAKHGQSGIEVSEIFPNIATCIDDICVVR